MDSKIVSQTIIEQIGKHCLFMIGANRFLHGLEVDTKNPFLQFHIGRNDRGISIIKIILDEATDTYIFKTFTWKGRELETITDVYCDCLNPLIAVKTGLATALEMGI